MIHKSVNKSAGSSGARSWLSLLLAIYLAGALSGCAAGQTCATGSYDCLPRPKVALILHSLANEHSRNMAMEALDQAAQDPSFDLTIIGLQTNDEPQEQIQAVESCIAQGYDIIALNPVHSSALVPAVKKAHEAGIIVVNFNEALDRGTLLHHGLPEDFLFVGPNNVQAARKMGDILGNVLPDKAQVALLQGPPSAFSSTERAKGFLQAVEAHSLELVAVENAEWDMEQARALTSELMRRYPDLQGIMACNDDMARGAMLAIEESGMACRIRVVGFDSTLIGKELLQAGKLLATAENFGNKIVLRAISIGLRILHGEDMTGWIQTPSEVITASRQPCN